jgi:hypothetical protein
MPRAALTSPDSPSRGNAFDRHELNGHQEVPVGHSPCPYRLRNPAIPPSRGFLLNLFSAPTDTVELGISGPSISRQRRPENILL